MSRKASSQNARTLTVATISSALKQDKSQNFAVVERNGAIVPFRRERIVRALEAAFKIQGRSKKSLR